MKMEGLFKLAHKKNKKAYKKLTICLLLYLAFRIPLLFLVPYFNTYVNYVMDLNVIFIPLIIFFTLITMIFFTEKLSHVFFNNKKIIWLYIKEIPKYLILNTIFLAFLNVIYIFLINLTNILYSLGFILILIIIFSLLITLISTFPFNMILIFLYFNKNDRKWSFFYILFIFITYLKYKFIINCIHIMTINLVYKLKKLRKDKYMTIKILSNEFNTKFKIGILKEYTKNKLLSLWQFLLF